MKARTLPVGAFLCAIAALGGCRSSEPAQASSKPSANGFAQKLASLPPDQRADYARTHMAEARSMVDTKLHPGTAK